MRARAHLAALVALILGAGAAATTTGCASTSPRAAVDATSAMDQDRTGQTLPMMTGTGPFGPIEMGGMFTVLKVRDGITSYDVPGWYEYPPGTVARKVT